MTSLLLDEQPLILLPRLATAIGLNEAIVLQQIHFLLGMKIGGRVINGHKWIWNTFEQWQADHFPFWCIRTLKTVVKSLEEKGLLITCQPDGRKSRKKYYRINLTALSVIASDRAEVAPSDRAEVARSRTETTAETTKSKGPKETAFAAQNAVEVDSPDISAEWKPSAKRKMTKEQLLAKLPVPDDYPSESEFEEFLEAEGCDQILSSRDLYSDLSDRKWHHWKQALHRWTRIKDWRKYVTALEATMKAAAMPVYQLK